MSEEVQDGFGAVSVTSVLSSGAGRFSVTHQWISVFLEVKVEFIFLEIKDREIGKVGLFEPDSLSGVKESFIFLDLVVDITIP